ncbi:MAG: sigma-70 family RNA polymerase sigma factor [Saprospiraceae bacterium]|nr:sigma-70 family RNA polymerase sigma factor [Saprospiraceae bacterium]
MEQEKHQFVSILAEYQAIIHKICRAFCPNPDDRQDLFQEITLHLWRSFSTFKGDSKISTWIYRVSLNVAIAGARKKRPLTEEISSTHSNIPEDDRRQEEEQIEAMFRVIYSLSDIEKAITLLYFENKTSGEIAALTGISSENVRVKLHRIRDKIRKQLSNYEK